MGKRIEMLWSGGWDSTFMLCKLLREYDEVQPYYIRFGRTNEEYEVKAIREIINLVQGHKEIQCKLLPVKFVDVKNIVIPKWLFDIWEKYTGEPYSVSKQYLFLAAFAMKHKGIAVGQERYYKTPGHLTRFMYEKGHMKFTDDGTGYFDKKDCDRDAYALFGNAVYPVCLDSELMMRDKAQAWGMMDIMGKSWFCYHPVNGKPCGMCGPCKVKMKQHMDFLFDKFYFNCSLVLNYLYHSGLKAKDGMSFAVLFEVYIRDVRSRFLSNKYLQYENIFRLFEFMLMHPPVRYRFLKKPLVRENKTDFGQGLYIFP